MERANLRRFRNCPASAFVVLITAGHRNTLRVAWERPYATGTGIFLSKKNHGNVIAVTYGYPKLVNPDSQERRWSKPLAAGKQREDSTMSRRTVGIAAAMFVVWAIGVSALAFVPKQSSDFDVGVSIGRSLFNDLRTSVYISHQDLSGKYTVIDRSPGRGYGGWDSFTDDS